MPYFGEAHLIRAAECGHHELCDYLLIELEANLEVIDYDGWTALRRAAYHNKTEVIKVLLKNDANIKAKGTFGHHATYLAAVQGNLYALKLLAEKDGDVIDFKGPNGETPLIAASGKGRIDVCKYLVEEKKANINLEDDGKNALIHAARSERAEVIKLLLQNKQRDFCCLLLLASRFLRLYIAHVRTAERFKIVNFQV